MRKLKIYNKEGQLVKVSNGDNLILDNLTSNTDYDEGDFIVAWEVDGVESNHVKVPAFNTLQNGVVLDIARRFIPLETLKKIIDVISEYKGDYLQLHFSDNDNYTIHSDILGQNGTETNNKYLTKNEVLDLIKYANDRNVLIIPDFDVPAHSKAWLDLVKSKYGNEIYNSIVSDFDDSLVNFYDVESTTNFIKRLLLEIGKLFYQEKYEGKMTFSIGTDEVPGASNSQGVFIEFVNTLSDIINMLGYIPRVWNDSYTYEGLLELDKSIEVMYWQQNGLTSDVFIENGQRLINANYYGLTFSPAERFKDNDSITEQIDYFKRTVKKNTFCHEDKTYTFIDVSNKLKGTTFTFWNENAVELNDDELLEQILPLIKGYLELFNK